MKLALALTGVLSTGVCLADVEKRDQFERTFQVGSAPELIVDNVFGSITVSGTGGNTARVLVRQRWTADTAEDMAQAQQEVRLDITQTGNTVRVYVDGPFRQDNGGRNRHMRYSPNYDFEIQVPRAALVNAKTVMGDVGMHDVLGAFQVKSVNGGTELTEVGGSGQVKTVNGPIRVRFATNPNGPVKISTVNGGVTAEFQPGLSADVQASTLNGGVYTDFAATPVAPPPVVTELRSGGKRVYRSSGKTNVRIGAGGPVLDLSTINGDIKIRQRGAN